MDERVGGEPGAHRQGAAGAAGGVGDVLQAWGDRAGGDAQGDRRLSAAAARPMHRIGTRLGEALHVGVGADQGDPGAGLVGDEQGAGLAPCGGQDRVGVDPGAEPAGQDAVRRRQVEVEAGGEAAEVGGDVAGEEALQDPVAVAVALAEDALARLQVGAADSAGRPSRASSAVWWRRWSWSWRSSVRMPSRHARTTLRR